MNIMFAKDNGHTPFLLIFVVENDLYLISVVVKGVMHVTLG